MIDSSRHEGTRRARLASSLRHRLHPSAADRAAKTHAGSPLRGRPAGEHVSVFTAAAISRLDGSAGDGVHLLWTALATAGYSVDGWDIQRRKATGKPEVVCRALSAAELDVLHRNLRLRAPFGDVTVREAACPEFPRLPPDDPHGDPDPPRRTCTRLDRLEPGRGENPRKQGRLLFEVRDASGSRAAHSIVQEIAGIRGLDCGFETTISLPVPATAVEVTLVHFAAPAEVEAFSVDGTSAGVARMSAPQRQPERLRLAGAALGRIVIRAPRDETLLLAACFEAPTRERKPAPDDGGAAGLRSRLPTSRLAQQAPMAVSRVAAVGTTGQSRCLAYDIRLPEGHRVVEVHAGLPATLAIAFRQGKAVDAKVLTAPSGTQIARFLDRDVDRVLLYAGTIANALQVCLDVPPDPKKEEREWASEPFIAKGIQIPVRALDSGLASAADEDALASSRLLAGEGFDAAAFRDVAEFLDAAAADADAVSPVWSSSVTRESSTDPFVELRTWPYALALLVDAPWRRMLGFGFLDAAANLTPTEAYDYRITGRFRRRDLEETLHGFHNIPRETTLPASFALGSVLLRTPAATTVELRPAVAANALTATGRKGIALSGSPCLTIRFPEPVTRIVLEVEPGTGLSWSSSTTEFIPGLTLKTFGGNLPADRRVTIEPSDPVDTVELAGTGFFYGLREVDSASGTKPDDVLSHSVVLPGIVFEDTLPPAPPAYLGTLNLQQPTVSTSPGVVPEPPSSLGFRLNWLPPPAAGTSGPMPWPLDLGAFPPFDVLGFHAERRRIDTGGAFEEIDGTGTTTLVFGSRSGRRDPPPLTPGIDLEAVFPETPPPTPPVPVFMSLDDVLVTAANGGPPPGSTHQYRLFSVDAIGRRSASPRLGSVVRLEKRQPPPAPVGPPTAPPTGVIAPAGVRARVLQAADPDLPTADRTLLGSSQNAVVLEWGWTQDERDRDPHATEFRVYWQPRPPDLVNGRLTGVASLAGGLYEMAATLDRPLPADAMGGRYIAAPDYPFKVASHTAGQLITVRLEQSALEPSRTPAAADLEYRPVLNGAELRPAAWAERSAVVPITSAESYQHVFRDRLTIDAVNPRVRVWVGVSAADGQTYVADELPGSATNGGRPGNESSIVAAPAGARFLGRPTFTVPPPLPAVPELVTDEPSADDIVVRVNLPALLPTVSIPAGHRVLLERVGLAEIVACVSARSDDRIGATFPDGTSQSFTLSNASDQAAFLAQIRTGTPARIEGRFLMDFLLRFPAQLEPLWRAAAPAPVAFGALTDSLPSQAERYVHRIRLADAAGHLSAGAALVPQIVRVPSLRSPAPPRLDIPSSGTNALTVAARVRDAFDLASVLLFTKSTDAAAATGPELSAPAQLLRLPNRRDLYPNDGLRLRLADGSLLAPATVIVATGGTVEPPDRVLAATLTPGYERRVAVWGVALTRDGVPSRFAGPVIALTGPTPLLAPTLTVASSSGTDTAQWSTLTVPALIAIERSVDGGATWRQVSPWLAETVTEYVLPSVAGTVRYRTVLRADRGRTATGPTVTPT